MTTLILPDIHEKAEKLQRILKEFAWCDRRTFLGDYLDSWAETPDAILEWLKDAVKDSRNEMLVGNHDAHYMFPNVKGLMCSGYKPRTAMLVSHMRDTFNGMKLVTRHEDWLISHAGVHISFKRGIIKAASEALVGLSEGRMSDLVGAGAARGGYQAWGGITWLDWNQEFEPIPKVNQICGHTEQREPYANMRKQTDDSDNWCLDTGLNHVATLEKGVITVHDVSKI